MPRHDSMGLGIMLYELTVGRLPYHPKSIAERRACMAVTRCHFLRHCDAGFPAGLEAIIVKSLAKKPEDRYRTAGELARALQELQTPAEPSRKPIDKKRQTMRVVAVSGLEKNEFATILLPNRWPRRCPLRFPILSRRL